MDGAFDRAYDAHASSLLFFPSRYPLEAFGDDPRYVEFLQRMNFTEAIRRRR